MLLPPLPPLMLSDAKLGSACVGEVEKCCEDTGCVCACVGPWCGEAMLGEKGNISTEEEDTLLAEGLWKRKCVPAPTGDEPSSSMLRSNSAERSFPSGELEMPA